MIRWKQKSFFVIGWSLLIAVLTWSQMGMYLSHLLFGVSVHVNIFKFCMSLFRENSLYYYGIVILLNTLIAYTVLITMVKTYQHYRLSGKFRKKITALHNPLLTESLNQQFNRRQQNLTVIGHAQPLAFTMGFRRPCIVLSSGLIEMLEEQELEAVIEHETFHQNSYDPLKIFILKLISQAIWFIPVTKWSYLNYTIISEILADEYAIQKTGSEIGLGGALLKLIQNGFSGNTTPTLAHFAEVSVNYRLQQLVDPQKTIPVRLKTTSIVISVYVLLLLMIMIMLAVT
jgi:Zn-dependent protease with chaperone function